MVLITRLVPSDPALVIPVWMNARICGHQVSTVVARRCSSGRPESSRSLVCSRGKRPSWFVRRRAIRVGCSVGTGRAGAVAANRLQGPAGMVVA
jgi:hypothetical protein